MPWDNIPFMVGGQVLHSAELARLVPYAGTGGREGIVRPSDLAVLPLASPGAGVRVSLGACTIINRTAGADAESYVARLDSFDTVTVANTTGGAARSDMIIARIEDPYQSGNPWPVPASNLKQTTVYVRTVVIPGVPAGAKTLAQASANFSGIPLARIDIPSNTAAVQAAHIVDLRQMAEARHEHAVARSSRFTGSTPMPTSVGPWAAPVMSFSVDIPSWATYMIARCTILDAIAAGATAGTLGFSLDTEVTTTTAFSVSGARRAAIGTSVRFYIPPSLRGTTKTFAVRGLRNGANDISVDDQSLAAIDVEWVEAPV